MASADTLPFPSLAAPARFALALATVSLVVLVDRQFGELVDGGSQFLMLATAVMASAWFGGAGPALLALIAGVVFGATDNGRGTDSAAAMHLALFVVHGLLVIALVAEMRHAHGVADRRATEADQARRSAEAAARMKDEFLGTLSHELRTPLNAALGWIHLIRGDRLDSATARRGLDSIERNVRQQAQLTGDLLDVSRVLTGRLHLEPRRTCLAEAARDACRSAHTAVQAKSLDLSMDLAPAGVPVLGDPERLRQIVWHLLANAIKFTPRGGRVAVCVDAVDSHARLTVFDSGPGIAPEFLPRIFDRFTQQDASPTRTAGGLGLGLSLVRELVELQGGQIRVTNLSDTPGALFTIHFPLQTDTAPLAPVARAGPGSLGAPLDGIRVLVFDPSHEELEVVGALLRLRGASVLGVDSLADALEQLEGWRPDVLMTSGQHDDDTSYSLVAKVPGLDAERGGRIPALALTRFSRHDRDVRTMLADNVSDLPKPLEPALLTAEIARLTGRERRATCR